ncbi:MAG: DUF4361 domain-containing protein [Paludibacter sp.]|nr:DUF4361 domain-containing protein [Paludibacter sp.]
MKNIILLPLALLSILFVGCDQESSNDKDLYPQSVYIVGAADKIVDRDLNIGDTPYDTVSISVAVSGSRPSDQDVTVTVGEMDTAITIYNKKNVSGTVAQYRKIADSVYTYPSNSLIIKAGQVYNTLPIHIKPASLQCDSLYMIALRLTSTTAYSLIKTDTVALVRLNLVNKYSGLYYMNGVIRNTDPTKAKDTVVYKIARNLKATDDGKTVRMYHFANEYVPGDINDYRPTNTFKITVNADNTLTLKTWKDFAIIAGGGTYDPSLKLYSIWYTFDDKGVIRKTTGYLYKARKTTAEQKVVDDWIEDHPLGK